MTVLKIGAAFTPNPWERNTWSRHLKSLLVALCTVIAFAAVDVDTASPADLDRIKGIGPGTSSKLLAVRQAGKFKDWSDLIERMLGIGEKRAAGLSTDGLTANGESFRMVVTTAKSPSTTDKPVKPSSAAVPKQ